jgi:dihydrofolate reductase
MMVSAVVAAGANDVIGANGALPWYLPEDLRRFRSLTTGHVVVMGRVTHESILARLGHPLPGRTSIVISRTPGGPGSAQVSHETSTQVSCETRAQVSYETSVPAALAAAARLGEVAGDREFFVIGGASVYAQALPSVDRLYLTRIHQDFEGDTFMPAGWLAGFELCGSQEGARPGPALAYSFLDYQREAS